MKKKSSFSAVCIEPFYAMDAEDFRRHGNELLKQGPAGGKVFKT